MQIFSLPISVRDKLRDLIDCKCSSKEELFALLWTTEAIISKNNFVAILDYLLNQPLLVELVLSASKLPMKKWLLGNFPTDQSKYFSSLMSKIIPRLSGFLVLQPLPLDEDTISQIQKFHHLQDSVPDALNLLSNLDLPAKPTSSNRPRSYSLNPTSSKGRRLTFKQNERDCQLLERFSLSLPTSPEDQEQGIASIMAQLKQLFEFYLETLRNPAVSAVIMDLLLERAAIENDQNSMANTIAPDEGAVHLISPFDDQLQNFGDWKIFISKRAEGNLRDAHKKSPKIFDIVMKKIRELSHGYFTDDNQKRLSGPQADVPIFEAKMSRDTRLVYQVHCEYNHATHVDEQVIRIFGVFTHAKLGKRLWDSIGRQLGHCEGNEYRQRCLRRQEKKTGFGDTVFTPATFPSRTPSEAPQGFTVPNLPTEDLEGVHTFLVLEKYVALSRGLLRSILADLEVSFPFHLSPQERTIVDHNGSCYVLGRSGTGKTTCMLYKIIWLETIQRMHHEAISRPRQVFVTKSVSLAKKVQEDFDKLSVSFQFLDPVVAHMNVAGSRQTNNGPSGGQELPPKYSQLQEEHFPLFISYDVLVQLIEGDYTPLSHNSSSWGLVKEALRFNKFRDEYWPHFPQDLTKGMDPNLVFNEILGVIKGSERTTSLETCYLDRESYRKLSIRAYPTFAGQRDSLYSLFEAYQKWKQQFGDYDSADRYETLERSIPKPKIHLLKFFLASTHRLLNSLHKTETHGKKIDQLYVDETQDNLLIDALVMRSLCHNVNGLFWAGDTAQTILAGSSFRFQDLKAFLYRIEEQHRDTVFPHHPYHSQSRSLPATFQLTTNYRSHMGITNCAHAVIELLSTFWPETIDALAPERGVVDGAKPVFLTDWGDNKNAHILSESSNADAIMELGPNQCILVRNEEAREALQSQLRNATIVTTIYDSKGLEFDDVLLLNFFEDSLCDVSQWRLVLNNIAPSSNQSHHAPIFDPLQHAGLCTELKFLYVAITRARKTLWIADRSVKAQPMKEYWSSRGQITESTTNAELEHLVVFSSPADWAIRAEDFFQRGFFEIAEQCFRRAALHHRALEAHAHGLWELARDIPTHSKHRQRQAFLMAAKAFMDCVRPNAGSRLESSFLVKAGQCYALAAEYSTAVDLFVKADDFDSAAICYIELGAFNTLARLFSQHKERISSATVTKIRDEACPYFYRKEDFERASLFFGGIGEEEEYLKGKNWRLILAGLYTRSNRLEEAASIYIQEGHMLQAIRLLLQCQPKHTRSASRHILNELWDYVSFYVPPINHPSIALLMSLWKDLDQEQLTVELAEEFRLLSTVLTSSRASLDGHGRAYLSMGENQAALLCLSQYFVCFPTKVNNAEDVAQTIHLFWDYITALTGFAFPDAVDMDTSPLPFHLFGIRAAPPSSVMILPNTFLYVDPSTPEPGVVGRYTKEGFEISRSSLKLHFRHTLDRYLTSRFNDEFDFFSRYLSHQTPCKPLGCDHKISQTLCQAFTTLDWHHRVYIILAHSLVMDCLSRRLGVEVYGIHKQKSHCLNLLYQSLATLLVNFNRIDLLNKIPIIEQGKRVVRYWTDHSDFALDYDDPNVLLLWFLRGAKTRVPLCDKQSSTNYTHRIRLTLLPNSPNRYFPFLHGPNLGYLIADLERPQLDQRTNRIDTSLKLAELLLNARCALKLDVLCTWLEYITGLVLLKPLWKNRENDAAAQRVTLPLNLAIQCIDREPDSVDTVQLDQVSTLFGLLQRLLLSLFSKSDRESFNLPSKGGFPGKDLNVARICRIWCLIAYNHRVFTPQIQSTFEKFKDPDCVPSSVAGRYVYSSSPRELLLAMASASPDQRLVRMYERKPGAEDPAPAPEVTTILYDRGHEDELYGLLQDLLPKSSPATGESLVESAEGGDKPGISDSASVTQGGPAPSGGGPACATLSTTSGHCANQGE